MRDTATSDVPVQALSNYTWLLEMSLPRVLCEAVQLWQSMENSSIRFATLAQGCEVERQVRMGHPAVLDPVPWSARLMSIIVARARKILPPAPFCALNWSKFGIEAGQPRLGDVICYIIENGPYVGLYVGEDDAAYHVVGAESDSSISIVRVPKQRLYAARSPLYQDAVKAVRSIALNRDGSLKLPS